MTEIMANLELNKYMSDDAPDDQSASIRRPLKIGSLLAIVLLVACYFGSDTVIERKKQELLSEVKTLQEVTVAGKAEVLQTWIEETGQRANLIANHPLFRLFAAEVNASNGSDLPQPLTDQLPYMQSVITSFVQQNNLVAAYVIGINGRAYLASNASPNLSDQQRQRAIDHYKKKEITTSPIRLSGETLIFDYLVPIFSAQSDVASDHEDIVGILVMTVSGSQQLANVIKPSNLSSVGEMTQIYQINDGNYYLISPTKKPYLSERQSETVEGDIHLFKQRELMDIGLPLYSVGASVLETQLVLLQAIPEDSALASLKEYSYGVYGLAGSFFIVVFSIVSGIWLTLRSQNAKALAHQYRDFARQINAQRRLLGSINNSIDDLIGLTDASGKYVYANPALARFVNYPINSVEGKTERDLFGDKTSRKLTDMNQQVIDTKKSSNAIIELDTHAGKKIIRIEKSRLLDDDELFIGIVTVAGDITDFIMNQRHKDELGRKTISLLVHLMEENDPYLAGHSHRMGELSSNVARIMDLSNDAKQTIATGANLSQIGKISIPDEIRTKESRLSAEETVVMQGHVGKAKNLLAEMNIDRSVITAVTQMYERQDGSGYPNQLKDAEIELSARILGIADILVARVSPRSYRQSISVEEAMEVFRTNPEKYDVDVVVALDAFLSSNEGRKFKDIVTDKSKARG